MDQVLILPPERIRKGFIPPDYLPSGKDEYYQRNKQIKPPLDGWRHLRADEVELLVKNNNAASSWDEILVTDPFDAGQIKNSRFFGLVRIGSLRNVILQHHDLRLPAGITNSLIISCDIGHDVAIHDVHYLAHYIIGDCNILFNIDEMHTTDHAKFGNGILKDGEPEQVRTWLDLMNESGARRVLPFNGMIAADAYLWAKYVDDAALQSALITITQKSLDSRRGYYGTTGDHCVIKNSRILKDVKIGSHAYIKGANKLKNLTINSSQAGRTQIGEGVELVNGIIGYGCRIFYGCKAVKFVLGNNSNLKYGARLINSLLGDNSTISCCEVLSNLIFPAHEQHHNNSFLVASVVMGQSNVAAGATIGSNHNSRANDNEIQAGRGFWPGLCTSLKHSCRFASYVLLAKADYPYEMDIPLPFSLVNNNVSKDQLEIMPAYWWMYNMYALARNAWKYKQRDTRTRPVQHIEFETLAPDTVEEIISAIDLLQKYGVGITKMQGIAKETQGIASLQGEIVGPLTIPAGIWENSRRPVRINKPAEAYKAYNDMLHFYAVTNLMHWLEDHPETGFDEMSAALKGERQREWVNMGGQLMRKQDVNELRVAIGHGEITNWNDIHGYYDNSWENYPLHKQQHAFAVLCLILDTDSPDVMQWLESLNKAAEIKQFICDQVFLSRKKDHDNPFRQATCRNHKEMQAAIGNIEDNPFIQQVREETEAFKQRVYNLTIHAKKQ